MWRILLAVTPFVMASCMPMAFRPARTVPEGKVEHTLGVSALSIPDDENGCKYDTTGDCFEGDMGVAGLTVPGASYTLRYGAAAGIDVGLGFATPTAFTLDATLQILRTRFFDLAVGPTFLWEISSNLPVLSAPVLADLNLGRAASVIAFGAPVLTFGHDDRDDSRTAVWLFQAGAGLEVRPTSWLSLRPYVSLFGPSLTATSGRDRPLRFYGLGLAFGGQREFR